MKRWVGMLVDLGIIVGLLALVGVFGAVFGADTRDASDWEWHPRP